LATSLAPWAKESEQAVNTYKKEHAFSLFSSKTSALECNLSIFAYADSLFISSNYFSSSSIFFAVLSSDLSDLLVSLISIDSSFSFSSFSSASFSSLYFSSLDFFSSSYFPSRL